MNIRLILTLVLSSAILTLSSQEVKRYYFTAELQSKFSIGTPNREIIEYDTDILVDVPKVSKFRNPVYGIDFSFNYMLNKDFSIGLGSGLNVTKYMYNPLVIDEYYDKVMIPVYVRINYEYSLQKEWILLSNINMGYQFSDNSFNNTDDGFILEEKGGLIAGVHVGVGKSGNRYSPHLKLGYEFNCFNNEHSIVEMGFQDVVYSDKINYRRYYHLLKLTLGIKI